MSGRSFIAGAAVTLIAAVLLIGSAKAQTCNETVADECIKTFSNVSTLFGSFSVNSSNMDPSCAAYDATVTCVETKAKCKDSDRYVLLNWLGSKNTIGYICSKEGRTEYQLRQPCLSNLTWSQQNFCPNVTYQDPVKFNVTADPACKQYTDGLKCQQAAGASMCGAQGGEFLRKLGTLGWDPQTKYVAPTCSGRCDSAALEACIKDFRPYGDKISAAALNATQLDDACKQYNQASDCVKKTTCADTDTITQFRWLGYRGATEYACGEGRNAYIANRDCLSNATYTQSRDQCKPSIPSTFSLQQACQAVVNQVQCVNNITESRCGKDAAGFMSKFFPRSLGPSITAGNPNCQLPGASSGMTLIASTLTLMMSLIIAALS